jgi:hypothetical protein
MEGQRFQTGVVTISNRGIKSGCTISAGTDNRNIDFNGGTYFYGGRLGSIPSDDAFWSVPGNKTGSDSFVYAYLIDEGSGFIPEVTGLGETNPENSIPVNRIDIPDGSDSETDPDLSMCTFNDIRRTEPNFPTLVESSVTEYVALPYDFLNTNYVVNMEIEDFVGNAFQLGYVYVGNKASNGFSIYVNGAVDSIQVRWSAQKYDL